MYKYEKKNVSNFETNKSFSVSENVFDDDPRLWLDEA